jgi:pyruvate dehydrogenase E2 component (dihydrolipoyllysine-residue acetyltransferase)
VRTMLPLSMSFDHRVVDGADVVRFLTLVIRLLEDPAQLLLEA